LAVVLQDNDNTRLFCSHLALRQGYAAAIIRFVNGLVDPLQLGVYARSIASIANQIGLPAWLVELRHAATHEDLPSLELLRQGAHEVRGDIFYVCLAGFLTLQRQSMQWLLDNYFLPKLNPSSAPPSRGSSLRPISPLLKQYKTLLKITTRDASLKAQYDRSIIAILRNIGRWFAEARLAANLAATGFGWDSTDQDTDSGDTDAKERWVLDRFCDAMLEKGALVPLSKRYKDLQISHRCLSLLY
jgi:ribosomal biogenesis protein LAS1